MNPKYRKPATLFIASFLPIVLGIVCRVQHWPGADTIFGAGMMAQMFSILWLIVTIIRPEKKG